MGSATPSSVGPGVVVFLHGHGAAPDHLADLGDRLGLDPSWRIIVPCGPGRDRHEIGSWFDTGPRGTDPDLLERSAEHLETAIDALLRDGGVPPSRLVLAGFSQGAAMALVLAARGVATGARLVLCCGWSPDGPGVDVDLSATGVTAALVQLRLGDDVVAPELTRWAAEALERGGCVVDLLDYPGPHAMSDEMYRVAGEWISGG